MGDSEVTLFMRRKLDVLSDRSRMIRKATHVVTRGKCSFPYCTFGKKGYFFRYGHLKVRIHSFLEVQITYNRWAMNHLVVRADSVCMGLVGNYFKMYGVFRIKFNISETNKLTKLEPERQRF